MTHYHFTGAYPRVLTGLSQGVNAFLYAAEGGSELPYGSTIVAHPGDALQTDEPYEHPELTEAEPSDDGELEGDESPADDETASDAHGLSPEDEAWAQSNPKPKPHKPAPADPTEN